VNAAFGAMALRFVLGCGDKLVAARHRQGPRREVKAGQTQGEEVEGDLWIRPGTHSVGGRE
jgi:hypothetical protein